MRLVVRPSQLDGSVRIPGSKSHTIRALVFAALAEGVSVIRSPLDSEDARSAVRAVSALGAQVSLSAEVWTVQGTAGKLRVPDNVIDVGNSGTTLTLSLGLASLVDGLTVFTGDEQIRRRPNGPLVQALNALGARVDAARENGLPPLAVRGPLKGGKTEIDAPNSQYLSSLLIACPLAAGDSEILVTRLYEEPYVRMTLDWLHRLGIRCEHTRLRQFHIPAGQSYPSFDRTVPGDFSTATFFLVGAALSGGRVTLLGLDPDDTQGDKAVIDMLRTMGAQIDVRKDAITVSGGELTGAEFDLNATPDALPAMAVAGACARGKTILANVPQARIKETDRIAVMCRELSALGARVSERSDGLEIEGGALTGTSVAGHGDHRVVMALALAGTRARGTTIIDSAEAMAITNPRFVEMMQALGADLALES